MAESSNNGGDASSARKERMRKEFDTLHREMEIAEYARTTGGHYRRMVPRSKALSRTKKRKLLEKSDATETAMHVIDHEDQPSRLRGSKRALDEDVIHGSHIFPEAERDVESDEDDALESEEIEENDEADLEDVEEQDEEVEEDDNDAEEDIAVNDSSKKPARKKGATRPKQRKRQMFRMRNFKSMRMAQRHGDALGAHARGQSRVAVETLEQVAADAPAAPQVYSSLGLVYEGLLSESRSKGDRPQEDAASIQQQIDLAKKAYGSYHVAAVLCKKDFTLWVRAADTAGEVASLYTSAMRVPDVSSENLEDYRSEKKKWLEEAKKDYTAADNLNPPGIDVPAKLAVTHIELGNLSEALTLLTDLKNRKPPSNEKSVTQKFRQRSDFERSYKAWTLYADLMLRIGHECLQWNYGVRTNENYMFKRWLRKYSESFDWQERRLQSLCLALEAAAGSESCRQLVIWTKQRALRNSKNIADEEAIRWGGDAYENAGVVENVIQSVNTNGVNEGVDDSVSKTDISDTGTTNGNADTVQLHDKEYESKKFQSEKEELLSRNRAELAALDEEMASNGLTSDSEAVQARQNMIRNHRASIVKLVGEFHAKVAAEESTTNAKVSEPLPISASCATVFELASELMKHCLKLDLYDAGILVADAVSSYFKERASLHERRMALNRTFTHRQQSTDDLVLLNIEPYDDVQEGESDEEEDGQYLSDDEIIDGSTNSDVIKQLGSGVLPPELTFIFALCLIGKGERTYMATKMIGAVLALRDEKEDDSDEAIMGEDLIWPFFRREMTGPLGKTAGFALISQVLEKTKGIGQWSATLLPFFDVYLKELESDDSFKNILDLAEDKDLSHRREQLLTITITASQMSLHQARLSNDQRSATPSVLATIDRLCLVLNTSWGFSDTGELSLTGLEALQLLEPAFSFLIDSIGQDAPECATLTKETLERFGNVISALLGSPIEGLWTVSKAPQSCSWKTFPLPGNWQNSAQKAMSTCVHNLSVGCNVSAFIGWERKEFNLKLIRKDCRKKTFGVHVSGAQVAGYVSNDTEQSLTRQWEDVQNLLPNLRMVDFSKSLEASKRSDWYKSAKKGKVEDDAIVASHGEKEGLSLFLLFSRLCLIASQTTTGVDEESCIRAALSVLVPITQFSLNMTMWHRTTKNDAISVSEVEAWKQKAEQEVEYAHLFDGPPVPPSRPKVSQVSKKRIEKQQQSKKQSFVSAIAKVPLSVLLSHWKDGGGNKSEEDDSLVMADAQEAMDKLNIAMKQLRKCFTDAAVERASLNVAVALLNLVQKSRHHCANPFLCLQQAQIFASQANKGGSSDEAFKHRLPPKESCTPLEALVILGRADCLQALWFPDEAVFLCSYVARVCRLHRQDQVSWNSQWMVVGICAYNVSVAIRTRTQNSSALVASVEADVLAEWKNGLEDAVSIASSSARDIPRGESVEEESANPHLTESFLNGNVAEGFGEEDLDVDTMEEAVAAAVEDYAYDEYAAESDEEPLEIVQI